MTLKQPPLSPNVSASSDRPLLKALNQNDAVKESIKQSADQLQVTNAVLKQGIADQAQTAGITRALQSNEAIEEQIQTSAKDLADVSRLLEHEIDDRIDIERELLATKAALAREKAKP